MRGRNKERQGREFKEKMKVQRQMEVKVTRENGEKREKFMVSSEKCQKSGEEEGEQKGERVTGGRSRRV